MADHSLTLARLEKRAKDDSAFKEGTDALGLGALALAVAWPTVRIVGAGGGFWASLGLGVGGAFGLAVGSFVAAGMLEDTLGRARAAAAGWFASLAVAAGFWWSAGASWWAPAVLTAIGIWTGVAIARADRRGHAQALHGLPEELVASLVAHGKRASAAERAALDRALDAYGHIHACLVDELAADDTVEVRRLGEDAVATLRALLRQQVRLRKLGAVPDEAVQAAAVEGRARAEALVAHLVEARAQLLLYAQARDAGDASRLTERVASLRGSTSALEEIAALEREAAG